MSFHHLTGYQNNELAKALMAFGRTVVLASVVAFLFPMAETARPIFWASLGIVLGGGVVALGVLLLKDEGQETKSRRGRRRG